jgi:hypothetical protein
VPKAEDVPNEDCWLASDTGTVCAIGDGASVSYDPGAWAAIVVRHFVEGTEVSRAWFDAAVSEYLAKYDREAMPWMHQAAFDQGSYTTLVGITLSADSRVVRVCTIGDSLFVLADSSRLLRTLPYMGPAEFDQSPTLLSTNPLANRLIDDAFWNEPFQDIDLTSCRAPAILLMTDALGRWLLEQSDNERLQRLLDIRDEDTFRRLVDNERTARRLLTDDTTLLVLA